MASDPVIEGVVLALEKMRNDLSAFFWDAFTALGTNGISGDYVEFGSAGGTSLHLAHQVARHSGVARHLWAFDSFEGLPEPRGPRDLHPGFRPGYDSGGVEGFHQRCRENGVPREAYTAVEGYFEDTLPPRTDGGDPRDVALAYVDCNMYSSTVTALEFLRPRLKQGMIVAFDDYWCWSSTDVSGERIALHEFLQANPEWHFERYRPPTWGAESFVVERSDALTG